MALTFRTAQKDDYDKIIDFLCKHFYNEEPCIRAMKEPVEEWLPILNYSTRISLKHPLSTIVTTENGDVAAVLLNSVWKRHDNEEEDVGDLDIDKFPLPIKKFADMLHECHANFWSLAPDDVNVVLYREISSVGLPWQRQGIASRMVTENLTKENVQKFKIDGIVSATSSFANQALLAKRGFTCLAEFPYSEIVSDEGQRLVETDDGSKAMMLNFKKIQDFEIL